MKSTMQHQMDELREVHGANSEINIKNKKVEQSGQEKDREIAELYEDLYQYKQDLKCFEDELALINRHEVEELLDIFEDYKLDSRDYNKDLIGIIEHHLQQKLEKGEYEASTLELLKGKNFQHTIEALVKTNTIEILSELKDTFIKRWEILIEIKKEHIKEEEKEIKVRGLKPYYAERVYKRYHGIS